MPNTMWWTFVSPVSGLFAAKIEAVEVLEEEERWPVR